MNMNPGRKRCKLPVAMRLYWKYLIGVAVFSPLSKVSTEVFHIPFNYWMIAFLTVGVLAIWPRYKLDAPYSFVIVAAGIWLVGCLCGELIYQIVKYAIC